MLQLSWNSELAIDFEENVKQGELDRQEQVRYLLLLSWHKHTPDEPMCLEAPLGLRRCAGVVLLGLLC